MTRLWYAPSLILLAASAMAQPMLPAPSAAQTAPDAQAMPSAPVARMYAVHARGAIPEEIDIDNQLQPIAPLLRELPFTSFKSIAVHDKEMPWGTETLFPINAVYSMFTTPLSLNEEGMISLQAHIEMLQADGSFVKALDTVAAAAQNEALMFRGMPLGADELVVVLLVALPSEESCDSDSSNDEDAEQSETDEAQPEPGDQDESQQNEDEEDETDAAREEDTELEDDQDEEGETEGVENIDALLQSLEDIDRREQREERNQRDRIDFKGDWW